MPNHTFDIDVAIEYGLDCAILIHHFSYWIEINRRAQRNFFEGKYWTYNTIEELNEHFPYWSKDQIYDLIEKLCTGKSRFKDKRLFDPVLLKGNFNKSKFLKTSWYSFINKEKFTKMGNHEIENANSRNRESGITRSNTDNNTDNKPICSNEHIERASARAPEQARSPSVPRKKEFLYFGKYVKLQPSEYEQLKILFGSESALKEMIERMNDWILAKGKPYKDYSAALRSWFNKKCEKEVQNNGNQGNTVQRQVKTGTWLNGVRLEDTKVDLPDVSD